MAAWKSDPCPAAGAAGGKALSPVAVDAAWSYGRALPTVLEPGPSPGPWGAEGLLPLPTRR